MHMYSFDLMVNYMAHRVRDDILRDMYADTFSLVFYHKSHHKNAGCCLQENMHCDVRDRICVDRRNMSIDWIWNFYRRNCKLDIVIPSEHDRVEDVVDLLERLVFPLLEPIHWCSSYERWRSNVHISRFEPFYQWMTDIQHNRICHSSIAVPFSVHDLIDHAFHNHVHFENVSSEHFDFDFDYIRHCGDGIGVHSSHCHCAGMNDYPEGTRKCTFEVPNHRHNVFGDYDPCGLVHSPRAHWHWN